MLTSEQMNELLKRAGSPVRAEPHSRVTNEYFILFSLMLAHIEDLKYEIEQLKPPS